MTEENQNIYEYDVLLVGAGPSNLTLGLRLVDLAAQSGQPLSLAILEKSKEIGDHVLCGALTHSRVLDKLFPDWREREGFPHEGVITHSTFTILGARRQYDVPNAWLPSFMNKEGYVALTLSDLVQYMTTQLEKKAAELENVDVDVYTGFAAVEPVFTDKGLRGVRVDHTGNDPDDLVHGKVTVLGEKGFVSRDVYDRFNLRRNPQKYAVGVKELWRTQENLEGHAWHTMGYPLRDGTFGGGFVYGLKNNRVAIGLILSLDSENPNLRPQQALQEMKKAPWLQKLISGGEMIKYGGANLPEGGFYSLPREFVLDGCLFVGDSLGVLDQQRLSGIDKGMESGWIAAEVIHAALQKGDFSAATLAPYQQKLMASFVGQELYEGRNFRPLFEEHPEFLKRHLASLCEKIDAASRPGFGTMISWSLAAFFSDPLLPFKGLKALGWIRGKGPREYTLTKDIDHINPDFTAPAFTEPTGFDKATIINCDDAVYTSSTHYEENQKHIDEFDAALCVRCVERFSAVHKDVPCVADCIAEVHRVDMKEDHPIHAMSFEDCIQCRTCEFVCPSENLRVNAPQAGSGPNFSGM
jgi:electron-transferring-flavoprotein dehydrogenase